MKSKPPPRQSKKPAFQISLDIELSQAKRFSIRKSDVKKRLQWLLSMVSDFSTALNIRFCGIEEMQETNFRFRKKNYPTDVLSFPFQFKFYSHVKNEIGDVLPLGDILICLPVCEKQALKARYTLSEELEKMLIHGIVHLKGFDHERGTNAWKIMTILEKALSDNLQNEFGKPKWCSVK